MIRKRTVLKLATSVALVALLCSGTALTAFATNFSAGEDSSKPAKAALTKIFKMPAGTKTPQAEFKFVFEKVGMNDTEDIADYADMPDIGPIAIPYAEGEGTADNTFVTGDTKAVVKESENFLGAIAAGDWKHGEGIYKYKVYEEDATTGDSYITHTGAEQEGESYSAAIYDVEVWVEADDGGILFPKYVAVKIIGGSVDEYYVEEGIPGEGKVNPTPGDEKKVPGTPPSIEDDFSQVIFTNKYWASDGGGENNPTQAALEIVKMITGNGAELSKYAYFNVKVTQPSVIADTQYYKAYVLDENGTIITSMANYNTLQTDGNGKQYILFTSGAELKGIRLTHEQRLAFVDLHVASAVEVNEDAMTGYTPTYSRTFPELAEFRSLVPNTPWGFPRVSEDDGPHFINAGTENTALFTNKRTGAAPMGINAEYLPYIAVIAAGLMALTSYVVLKSRKESMTETCA